MQYSKTGLPNTPIPFILLSTQHFLDQGMEFNKTLLMCKPGLQAVKHKWWIKAQSKIFDASPRC